MGVGLRQPVGDRAADSRRDCESIRLKGEVRRDVQVCGCIELIRIDGTSRRPIAEAVTCCGCRLQGNRCSLVVLTASRDATARGREGIGVYGEGWPCSRSRRVSLKLGPIRVRDSGSHVYGIELVVKGAEVQFTAGIQGEG